MGFHFHLELAISRNKNAVHGRLVDYQNWYIVTCESSLDDAVLYTHMARQDRFISIRAER